MSILQSPDQGFLINNLSSSRVDDNSPLLQRPNLLLTNQPNRMLIQRTMHTQHINLLQQRLHRRHILAPLGCVLLGRAIMVQDLFDGQRMRHLGEM
jgi:hypothetical protein